MQKSWCYSCKQYKQMDEFYKCHRTKSGVDCICKQCKKQDEKEWRDKNRESRREKQRDYYELHKDDIMAKRKESFDPKKDKARKLAHKIPVQKCIFCEKMGERHHPDYDNPLDIIFLCKSHHKQVHDGTIKIPVI